MINAALQQQQTMPEMSKVPSLLNSFFYPPPTSSFILIECRRILGSLRLISGIGNNRENGK